MPDLKPHIDLFAILILLGIIQGGFLVYFFLTHSKGKQFPNRFLGIALLSMIVLMSDVWLGYTNYMVQVLGLVDSTEPVNLVIFPCLYLYFRTSLRKTWHWKEAWHFLPAALYLVYMVAMWYPQPLSLKYEAFLDAFHPEVPQPPFECYGERWMFWPKWHINDFTGISMVIYLFLGWKEISQAFKRSQLSLWSSQQSELLWYRNLMVHLTLIVIIYLVTRATFESDLGDHLVVAHMAFVIYATSFTIIRQSGFFKVERPEPPKYERSSLTPELQRRTLEKLQTLISTEKPYLDSACSLPKLAQQLGVSTHHLSQVLNDAMGLSFFEWLAKHRIQEAKELLRSSQYNHLKIEEIAESVGYNSKSAFNGAFKRETGQTPAVFRSSSLSAGTSS
ncbi:helix-turn-helix transcriptional regulator [Siphonobacter sp. SORGH_AS_0500]|uniref:helix-turn-helix domain-containing protein n=2 Tax=unclassified Siphonobacter TaxID=2635712 RepID=UPI00285F2841|nr:helix-turn-helix transcriptional regulator [Siphonobacter sp. SORGH_AS_0500]MDR6196489.1 AraC-like DNA-binding protein [Siphonobacter sp. SORGH_AS_0500]